MKRKVLMVLTRTVFPNHRRGHLQRQSHPRQASSLASKPETDSGFWIGRQNRRLARFRKAAHARRKALELSQGALADHADIDYSRNCIPFPAIRPFYPLRR